MGFKKGVFGGSQARIRWRLLRVMMSMWILIFTTGVLFHFYTGTPMWLLPELYFIGLPVFHTWHWATHQRWLLYPMWKVHMYHHWTLYPPSRFMTTVYLHDGPGRTPLSSFAHDGPLYIGMLTNLVVLYYLNLLSPTDIGICLLVYGFVSSFAVWLHQTFHIQGHWIERFVYFHDLRALHLVHHQGTAKHNYGFLDHSCDIIGDSLLKADFSLSNSWNQKTDGDKDSKKIPVQELPSSLSPSESSRSRSASPAPSPTPTPSPYTAGEMPTLSKNGFKECLFAMTCVTIEVIVGLLGVLLGNARDNDNSKKADSFSHTGDRNDSFAKQKKDFIFDSAHGGVNNADSHARDSFHGWAEIFLFN